MSYHGIINRFNAVPKTSDYKSEEPVVCVLFSEHEEAVRLKDARILEIEAALTESLRVMDMNFHKTSASVYREAARRSFEKKFRIAYCALSYGLGVLFGRLFL